MSRAGETVEAKNVDMLAQLERSKIAVTDRRSKIAAPLFLHTWNAMPQFTTGALGPRASDKAAWTSVAFTGRSGWPHRGLKSEGVDGV